MTKPSEELKSLMRKGFTEIQVTFVAETSFNLCRLKPVEGFVQPRSIKGFESLRRFAPK